MGPRVVIETHFPSLRLVARGKVRDVYEIDEKFLIVSTDRLSAFDVILPDPIPHKGQVLNTLSAFWMNKTTGIVPNHLITTDCKNYPEEAQPFTDELSGRSMLVARAEPFPVECVVRRYIVGSGWKDYQRSGKICGISLPKGLKQAEKLPEPIFTPSTKAAIGDHDENISMNRLGDLVGEDTARWLRDKSIELYLYGSQWAEERGIIIADTKFEFGLVDGIPTLIDEVLTPDSSRFWPSDQYRTGISPPSLDKQFVRDYLEAAAWDKKPPAPSLSPDIIAQTEKKYLQIHRILTGKELGCL